MFTPETIVASVTLFILALLLVLALLRSRLKEWAISHLAVFTGLAFASNLLTLMGLLNVDFENTSLDYGLATEFIQLAMILSFGALTLSFLKKGPAVLVGYWSAALIILAAWSGLVINFEGRLDAAMRLLAYLGLNINATSQMITLMNGLGWLVSIITVLLSLIQGFRKQQPTQYLNRLRYWLIVTTLLSLTGLSLFAGQPETFYSVGLALLAAATLLASYTVLSYHTPDLKLLVGWGIHYVGMTGILAGLTLLGFWGAIQIYLLMVDTPNLWPWLAVLAVALANLYSPVIRAANQLLTRFIFGKVRNDARQMIKRYNQGISSTLDLQRLSDVTVDLMTETMNIDRSVVFVNEREARGEVALRPFSAVGLNGLIPKRFTTDNPFIRHFLEKHQILSQYDVDVRPEFRAMAEEERKWLAALGMELYVPVLREQELLAVLGFGPKAQGVAYNQDEQDLILMLADQTGLAFEGSLLFQQLKMVNEEVGILSDRLSILDQSKADFLAVASHELRTPLTQIHTYSQLLLEFTEEDLQDEAYVKQVFEGIAQGSERMRAVIDLMLDISAADLGIMHLFKGPVVLGEVYQQAVHQFLPVLEQRQLKLAEQGLANLPVIEADGARLVQVLENLIGNAIKYTPNKGKIRVQGYALVDDRLGKAIQIDVNDTGIGINPEYHETIFDKFFRVEDSRHHSTSKTNFKGAGPGLGLTLVKAVVEAHGGRVWVESKGCDEARCPGATFSFIIPVAQPKPKVIPAKAIEVM
jgi:signal transduction histidine kinase